ncbi:MAG: hypothetical protein GVY17_09305 [Cyanobacteria bacterium]|nr:hypothetical protein [Cyanobacteria bacterium GSL.Bin21]
MTFYPNSPEIFRSPISSAIALFRSLNPSWNSAETFAVADVISVPPCASRLPFGGHTSMSLKETSQNQVNFLSRPCPSL